MNLLQYINGKLKAGARKAGYAKQSPNGRSPEQERARQLARAAEQERLRLLEMPRYTPTRTTLLDRPIEVVDACTFLGGSHEIFDKGIYEFKAGTETPFIIDCGANIGLSVIYFKHLYPKASVVAFEPDQNICNVLRRNVAAFGFTEVTVFGEAIWKTNGFIEFLVEGGFSGRIPKPEDEASLVRVPARRLRDLLLDRPVDFLKIDIEGAEYEVLLDCQDALGGVEHIFIEYHSHSAEPQRLNEILSILTRSGFRYHVHEAYTRPRPYVQRELMLGMDLQLDVFGYRA